MYVPDEDVPLIEVITICFTVCCISTTLWGVWYCHRTPVYSQIRERKNIHLSHELSVVLCLKILQRQLLRQLSGNVEHNVEPAPIAFAIVAGLGLPHLISSIQNWPIIMSARSIPMVSFLGAQRISYWNVTSSLDKVRLLKFACHGTPIDVFPVM